MLQVRAGFLEVLCYALSLLSFFFHHSALLFSSHNSAIIVSCLPSSYEKGLFTILPHRVTFAFFSSEQEAEGVLTFQFRDTSTIFIKAS